MDVFKFDCDDVSSWLSYSFMVYSPFDVVECLLTPIVFIFYILFGLGEVRDASEFILTIIGKIRFIMVDGEWCLLNITLFWG